jgi:hypothetical protein
MFAGASQQYIDRGIADARPQVVGLTWPTRDIALAEVRWSFVDASGQALGEEVATYTLRRAGDGQLKARILVAHE